MRTVRSVIDASRVSKGQILALRMWAKEKVMECTCALLLPVRHAGENGTSFAHRDSILSLLCPSFIFINKIGEGQKNARYLGTWRRVYQRSDRTYKEIIHETCGCRQWERPK